ncbi:MAG: hypothetical protein L3K17_01085 [Thermoplasmata archaeon]|nr:hypothetical protein [Thermoplasmata archaeon]
MSAWGRLSFNVVLVVLAAVTLAGVIGLRLAGAGIYALAFILVPVIAAIVYVYENRDHPPIDLSPRPSPPAPGGPAAGTAEPVPSGPAPPEEPMPSGDEPFDDPVELADRIDRGGVADEEPPEPRSAASKTPPPHR